MLRKGELPAFDVHRPGCRSSTAGTCQRRAAWLAIGSFEPVFYNNIVLIVDSYFVHRTRAVEKKDGNSLNEVRMLCDSMLHNNDVMRADRTIKYKFLATGSR